MVEVKQVVEKFQDFRGDTNINSVVGGLLLEIVENGSSGGSSGSTATSAKQQELIDATQALIDAIAPSSESTPDFIIGTVDGTVAVGAKYIKFTFYPETICTVKGKSIPPELATLEFPFNYGKYKAIPYTVASGTVVITTVY